MRIPIPEAQLDNPIAHLASNYHAQQIVAAGIAFSKAGYQQSCLSLHSGEA